MRVFSDNEKNAIKSIVNGEMNSGHNYLLINAYNDLFNNCKVAFVGGHLQFYYDPNKSLDISEVFDIEHQIVEISFLVQYLEDNRLIFLLDDGNQESLTEIKNFETEGLRPVSKAIDGRVTKKLQDCLNHRVFVSHDLINLVDKDFLTVEDESLEETKKLNDMAQQLFIQARYQYDLAERGLSEAKQQTDFVFDIVKTTRKQSEEAQNQSKEAKQQTQTARKQTRLSIIALIFSIVAIITGIISSIWVAKSITMDVKIDPKQMETVTSNIREISERIDSLDSHLKIVHERIDQTVQSKSK